MITASLHCFKKWQKFSLKIDHERPLKDCKRRAALRTGSFDFLLVGVFIKRLDIVFSILIYELRHVQNFCFYMKICCRTAKDPTL